MASILMFLMLFYHCSTPPNCACDRNVRLLNVYEIIVCIRPWIHFENGDKYVLNRQILREKREWDRIHANGKQTPFLSDTTHLRMNLFAKCLFIFCKSKWCSLLHGSSSSHSMVVVVMIPVNSSCYLAWNHLETTFSVTNWVKWVAVICCSKFQHEWLFSLNIKSMLNIFVAHNLDHRLVRNS